MHGILGKESSILLRKLGGERLIVREDEGRRIVPRDNVRDRERLSASRNTEERLVAHAFPKPSLELLDRLRLVARRSKRCMKFKIGHTLT